MCLFLSPVIRARIIRASFNDTLQERKYRVKIIKVFRSVVELKEREDIFVLNDYCQCPRLELRGQYVIMGTVEQVSVTHVRLLIPPRPFVWIWKSRMEAGFQTISDICDHIGWYLLVLGKDAQDDLREGSEDTCTRVRENASLGTSSLVDTIKDNSQKPIF